MEITNFPAKVNETELVAELKAAFPALQFSYLPERTLTKPDNTVETFGASLKVAALDGSPLSGQDVAAVRQAVAAHAPAKSDDETREANAKARADAIIAKILTASPAELQKLKDALAAL